MTAPTTALADGDAPVVRSPLPPPASMPVPPAEPAPEAAPDARSTPPAPGLIDEARAFRGYVPVGPDQFRTLERRNLLGRTIYLNRCDHGCNLTPGFEDSRKNRSSIIGGPVQISAYSGSDEEWQRIVNCVRQTYAPFAVSIVDDDPGNVPHFEAMVAGLPQEGGWPPGIVGVAPFDSDNCNVIENSISFVFANSLGDDTDEVCWTVAQEVAHGLGLDHELLCEDPMTYLNSCGTSKRFQNQDAPCGEFSERACECNARTQNSYRKLLDVFGPRTPTPPVIRILEPAPGEVVPPGFVVRAEIIEDTEVDLAELRVNGERVEMLSAEPFTFRSPLDAPMGPLEIEVWASDIFGAAAAVKLELTQERECTVTEDCELTRPGHACLEGRCVAGPRIHGGLGQSCFGDGDCVTGVCARDHDSMQCTEPCLVNGETGCPGGFVCQGDDVYGVCRAASGGCGCRSGNTPGPLSWLLAAMVLATLRLRRRRG